MRTMGWDNLRSPRQTSWTDEDLYLGLETDTLLLCLARRLESVATARTPSGLLHKPASGFRLWSYNLCDDPE